MHIEAQYRDLPFPFDEIAVPPFAMEVEWRFADLLGYVDTWSPVRMYRRSRGSDPLLELRGPLGRVWGPRETRRKGRFPLHVRAGRVPG